MGSGDVLLVAVQGNHQEVASFTAVSSILAHDQLMWHRRWRNARSVDVFGAVLNLNERLRSAGEIAR